jgi:hypothetical protein
MSDPGRRQELEERPDAMFFVVSDAAFFLGAVALVNSLRLAGHREPVCVVDNGLTAAQRAVLEAHVEVLDAPASVPAVFLAPYGPRQRDPEIAVLLDADILVTRPLFELLEHARAGLIVAFVDDPPCANRFFPEWQRFLGAGPLRRHLYVNAGQLVVPASAGETLFEEWARAQSHLALPATRYGRGRLEDPFYFADQDVLNAVLAAHFSDDQLMILEHRLAPHAPFPGLSVLDPVQVVCQYGDGTRPYVLHHVLAKPWLKSTRTNAYSQLLPRLLLADDVEIRIDPGLLPLRLRTGRAAEGARLWATVDAGLRASTRQQIGRFGIRTRLRRWRNRAVGA